MKQMHVGFLIAFLIVGLSSCSEEEVRNGSINGKVSNQGIASSGVYVLLLDRGEALAYDAVLSDGIITDTQGDYTIDSVTANKSYFVCAVQDVNEDGLYTPAVDKVGYYGNYQGLYWNPTEIIMGSGDNLQDINVTELHVLPVWLSYCTDDNNGYVGPNNDAIYGVRFTPPANSGLINRVSVYSVYEGFPASVHMVVYLYHVAGGIPTILMASSSFCVPELAGWQMCNFNYSWSGGAETEFLVAVKPEHYQFGMSYINSGDTWLGKDSQIDGPNRNWTMSGSGDWTLGDYGGDFMIRVEFCPTGADSNTMRMIRSLLK
jgi:hypothetical protein